MKLYIYNGSEVRKGNADMLLNVIGKDWRDRGHSLYVNDKVLLPCKNCGQCKTQGICKIDNNLSSAELQRCDGIVIVSPIYFFSFSAKSKLFLDRLYSLNLSGKILTAITLSGSETDTRYCGTDIIKDVLKRTSEYCGSVYVEPLNFVTGDKGITYPIKQDLKEFIKLMETQLYYENLEDW